MMNKTRPYKRARLVQYSPGDLRELIGPVKTQYAPCDACAVDLPQAEYLQVKPDQTLDIRVDTFGCENFAQVRLEVPGEPTTTVPVSAGSWVNGEWVYSLSGLQFVVAPGDYPVVVTLIDEFGNENAVCSALLTVIL